MKNKSANKTNTENIAHGGIPNISFIPFNKFSKFYLFSYQKQWHNWKFWKARMKIEYKTATNSTDQYLLITNYTSVKKYLVSPHNNI